MRIANALLVLALAAPPCVAQKRLVLIDQDGSGPGGSNQMAMLSLLQSPQVEVLGITMVTGNAWRDEETLHTLRMLELTGHSNVPVAKGAVFPLVRTQRETQISAQIDGKVSWLGAWGQGPTMLVENGKSVTPVTPDTLQSHGPYEIPPMPEGQPTLKPIEEDAVHFLIRQVHAHPHQVTIYAAGPLTNIALAISIDPEFAALTQGHRRHGRQPQSANRRSRIRHQSTSRIQLLVRSRSRPHRASRRLAPHRRHHRRHFHQGAVHREDARRNLPVALTHRALHRCLEPGTLLSLG